MSAIGTVVAGAALLYLAGLAVAWFFATWLWIALHDRPLDYEDTYPRRRDRIALTLVAWVPVAAVFAVIGLAFGAIWTGAAS